MKKQQLLLSAAALALGFSAIPALAASSSGDTKGGAVSSTAKQLDCKGLKGPAHETCLQHQKNAARTPGHSEDSASRTGTPPGKMDPSPMGAPAAGGTPKGSSSSPKK